MGTQDTNAIETDEHIHKTELDKLFKEWMRKELELQAERDFAQRVKRNIVSLVQRDTALLEMRSQEQQRKDFYILANTFSQKIFSMDFFKLDMQQAQQVMKEMAETYRLSDQVDTSLPNTPAQAIAQKVRRM